MLKNKQNERLVALLLFARMASELTIVLGIAIVFYVVLRGVLG